MQTMQTTSWRDDQTFTLPDGRVLGYRTHGPATGLPLFVMHGTPGSRLFLSDVDRLSQVPGLFIVTTDRPGYGLSSPQQHRTLLGWAADVHALAQHLRFPKYWVAGASGGAPHALACAFCHPDAVQAAYLICSPAPRELGASWSGMAWGNRIAFFLSRHWPGLLNRMGAATAAACRRDPDDFLNKTVAQMPGPDQALVKAPGFRDAMVQDLREAYRQGHLGLVADLAAQFSQDSWGMRFSDVRVPVLLWHGEDDKLAPVSMAKALHRAIPGSRLVVLPGKGHFLTEEKLVVQEISAHMGATGAMAA